MEKNILINVGLILAFFSVFLLFLVTIFNSKNRRETLAFSFTCLSVSLWTLGIAMFRLTDNLKTALFWNREFIFTAGMIPSTFFHFAYVFSTKKKLKFYKKLFIYFPSCLILILVFSKNVFIRDILIKDWGKESILGFLYPYYGIYFTGYMTLSFYFLFGGLFKAKGIFKMQLVYIIIAFGPSILSCFPCKFRFFDI